MIIGSFLLFEAPVQQLWSHLLNSDVSLAVLAVLIVALLAADVVLPIPSSIVSITAAVIFGTFIGGAIIFIGMSLCCLFGYYLGKTGHRFVKADIENNVNRSLTLWIERWGVWTLLFSRPVPVMAETSIVMAGVIKVPMKKFLVFTIPANAVIAGVYSVLV